MGKRNRSHRNGKRTREEPRPAGGSPSSNGVSPNGQAADPRPAGGDFEDMPAVAGITLDPSVAGEDRTDPATARALKPKRLALELWHGFFRTGVTSLATQFAYSLFFATFPLLVLVMSLAALADRVLDVPVAATLREIIDRSAPEVLQDLLLELVDRAVTKASTGVISVSAGLAVLLAIWGASGAVGTLVGACTRAYGVRSSRPFPIRRLVNALLAMVVVLLIIVAAALFVYGETIGRSLADWLNAGELAEPSIVVGRWVLVVACTMIALLLVNRVAPEIDLALIWLLPGAAFSTGLWLLLLKGFSALMQITNPGDPYGAFSGLVVLLWFFYLTGVAFMLGIVLNATLGRRFDTRRRAAIARDPRKRLFCDDGREW